MNQDKGQCHLSLISVELLEKKSLKVENKLAILSQAEDRPRMEIYQSHFSFERESVVPEMFTSDIKASVFMIHELLI